MKPVLKTSHLIEAQRAMRERIWTGFSETVDLRIDPVPKSIVERVSSTVSGYPHDDFVGTTALGEHSFDILGNCFGVGVLIVFSLQWSINGSSIQLMVIIAH